MARSGILFRLLALLGAGFALVSTAMGDEASRGQGETAPQSLAPQRESLAQAGFTVTHANGNVDQLVAHLFTGEDAASASVTFCLEYGFQNSPSTILDVARNLALNLERDGNVDRAALEAVGSAREPLKTAGAYKKRAAAAASEDRYEDAAADYIRASLRPGIDPQAPFGPIP